MKPHLILSSALSVMFINNSYAWVHRDMGTNFCNLSEKTIHFVKSYNYQANTNNDHSQDFILKPKTCASVDFWSQVQNSGYDLDNNIIWKMSDEQGQSLGQVAFHGKTDTGIVPISRMRFGINSDSLSFVDYPGGQSAYDLNSNELRNELPFSPRITSWLENVKEDNYTQNKTYFSELKYDGTSDHFHYGTIQITDYLPTSVKNYEDYDDHKLHPAIPVDCSVKPSLSVLPVYNMDISLTGTKAANQKISYMVVDKDNKTVKVPQTQSIDNKIQFSFQDPENLMYCKDDDNSCYMTAPREYRLVIWGLDVNGINMRTNIDFSFDSGNGTKLQKTFSDNLPSQAAGFYGLVSEMRKTPASLKVTFSNVFGTYHIGMDNANGDLMYSGDLHWNIGILGSGNCNVSAGRPDTTNFTRNGFNDSFEKKLNITMTVSLPYHSDNYVSYTAGKNQRGFKCYFGANAQFNKTSALACDQF